MSDESFVTPLTIRLTRPVASIYGLAENGTSSVRVPAKGLMGDAIKLFVFRVNISRNPFSRGLGCCAWRAHGRDRARVSGAAWGAFADVHRPRSRYSATAPALGAGGLGLGANWGTGGDHGNGSGPLE